MEKEYTQGPWELDGKNQDSTKWYIGIKEETPIFSILCARPEAEANVQLITSAPDLLDACYRALMCAEKKEKIDTSVENALRQAIEKAIPRGRKWD